MKDLILKRITIFNLSLLLMATVPQISFAQIIHGLEQARHFNTSHNGPFSIYARTFRVKKSASQLRDKIAVRTHYSVRVISTGQLYAVVIGPLPSSEAVRATGESLAHALTLTPNQRNKGSKQALATSSTVITRPQNVNMPLVDPLTNGIRVTVLAGGSSYALNKHQQVFFPTETFRTDSFEIDRNKINFSSGIGVSYEKKLDSSKDKPWNLFQSISLGVNAYYNEISRNGSVYEYSLPDFNNATYNMKIKSYRIMLDTEWVLHPLFFGVMPFVEAGVGGAQNTLNFQNIPRPNIGADGGYYNLPNHTNTHFAYELGAGFKMLASNHLMISARYLFADPGNANSGVSDNNTGVLLANPVNTNLQSQSVLFGLSYLFG